MIKILDELRVADVVPRHASERPDATAISHGDRHGHHAQLDERSSRLAQLSLPAAAGPGARVAHLDRSAPEVVELFVGPAFAAPLQMSRSRASASPAASFRARSTSSRTYRGTPP